MKKLKYLQFCLLIVFLACNEESDSGDETKNPIASVSPTSSGGGANNTAPTFTVSAPTPSDVNSSGTANFTVTYADYNTITLSYTDITLNQTGAACSTVVVSGSGNSRNVAVSGCLGDGTVGITVNANSAIDVVGNQAAESSPSSTFNVSNAPPTIAVTGPDDNDVNSTGTSTFTVTYGNYDTISLSEGDITLNQTGAACTTKTITGTGDTRSVAISGCTETERLDLQLSLVPQLMLLVMRLLQVLHQVRSM